MHLFVGIIKLKISEFCRFWVATTFCVTVLLLTVLRMFYQ